MPLSDGQSVWLFIGHPLSNTLARLADGPSHAEHRLSCAHFIEDEAR